MRPTEAKFDWFYEQRPMIITVFGLLGLFSKPLMSGDVSLLRISQSCGVVLLLLAYRIYEWRRVYRQSH